MSIEPLVHSVCVHSGRFGWIFSVAHTLPRTVWLAKSGLGFVRRDLYLFYFSISYYLEVAFNAVLQQYYAEARPNTFCSAELGFPSQEVQLSFMFVGFVVGHVMLWREKMELSSWIYSAVLAVYVPFGMWYNGMNDVQQVLAGALVGLITGFARVYVYKYYLHPLVPSLLQLKLFKWLSYNEHCPGSLVEGRSVCEIPPNTPAAEACKNA